MEQLNQRLKGHGELYVHGRDKDGKVLMVFAVKKHIKGTEKMDDLKTFFIYMMERIDRFILFSFVVIFFVKVHSLPMLVSCHPPPTLFLILYHWISLLVQFCLVSTGKTMAISWPLFLIALLVASKTWTWSWSSTWFKSSRTTTRGASTTFSSSRCLGFSTVRFYLSYFKLSYWVTNHLILGF